MLKNDIEQSWPIKSGANCDENHIRQLHDWLYGCGLHWKQIWDAMIDWTWLGLKKTNHTGVIYAKNDTQLLLVVGLGIECEENQIG